MTPAELKARYGTSEHGNFAVIDTIGVPHTYCIGARHVTFAADRCGGVLGKEAIERAERQGIVCETCKGRLTYAQHETALLVECNPALDLNENTELHAYLVKSKPLCEADKYAGFAFIKRKDETNADDQR